MMFPGKYLIDLIQTDDAGTTTFDEYCSLGNFALELKHSLSSCRMSYSILRASSMQVSKCFLSTMVLKSILLYMAYANIAQFDLAARREPFQAILAFGIGFSLKCLTRFFLGVSGASTSLTFF
jgi:hypothetical protein